MGTYVRLNVCTFERTYVTYMYRRTDVRTVLYVCYVHVQTYRRTDRRTVLYVCYVHVQTYRRTDRRTVLYVRSQPCEI